MLALHSEGGRHVLSRPCSQRASSAAVQHTRSASPLPPAPLPLPAENYRLLDVPVDLLAGAADGVIPPACVLQHVHHLRAAGVPCSFRILPFGHLDFTFGVKEDIRGFVLSKLRRPL